MELYKLRAVLREPSEDTEDERLAEIPDLPGCRAWGDTLKYGELTRKLRRLGCELDRSARGNS